MLSRAGSMRLLPPGNGQHSHGSAALSQAATNLTTAQHPPVMPI